MQYILPLKITMNKKYKGEIMQKNKTATIIIIILILAYGLLGTGKFIIDINVPYLYIINPLFWIILAVFLKIVLPNGYEKRNIKKEIISYVIIASFSYIIVYIISGLFVTFGNNPYATTLSGYITNLWIFMSIIVAKEYVRYKLINNVYSKDKILIAVLITICYVIIDFGIYRLINAEHISLLMVIELILKILLPAIAKNILFSYIATFMDYKPAIIYEFITNTYMWISPVLPNSPWLVTVIIEAMIPIILFLYIRYTRLKNELFKSREKLINSDPRHIIVLVTLVVLATWFALGIFPIVPISIASASMVPEFNIGDVVIIQKCNVNDVTVGDIIQYKLEGYTVVHRVIQKNQNDGRVTFITKGDNNNSPDSDPVTEDQLIGKAIFKIKYIGYPAIWLHLVEEQEELNVKVETGK